MVPQHLVAGEVAGVVVHELEVVEVEQEQRAVLALAFHSPQLPAEAVHESATVEEPRQRVVVSKATQLALGLLAVADVLDLEDVVERVSLGTADECRRGRDPDRIAVRTQIARLVPQFCRLVDLDVDVAWNRELGELQPEELHSGCSRAVRQKASFT